jgi:hypothetical protein
VKRGIFPHSEGSRIYEPLVYSRVWRHFCSTMFIKIVITLLNNFCWTYNIFNRNLCIFNIWHIRIIWIY